MRTSDPHPPTRKVRQLLTTTWRPKLSSTIVLVVLSSFLVEGEADRTNEKIYELIEGSYPCFRKLNGSHQVGCGSSSLNGDVGVVHLVDDEESLAWVTKNGPHNPYVALIYPNNLTQWVMLQFKRSERVAGVLVLNSTDKIKDIKNFSMDLTCPNQGFGLYRDSNNSHYCEKWNDVGESILWERYDFPVFYVQKEQEAQAILDCYNSFNRPVDKNTARDWPLCAAQLKAFMLAAVDTPTCLRRSERFNLEQQKDRVCDPMGDLNLWASVLPSNQSEPYGRNSSVVVISAKLDAASMFEGLARGADSAGTGIATFLAVLKHLSGFKDLLQTSNLIDNVYFILFHGESFGYIGSSRMVYDMKKGDFPPGIRNDTQNTTAMLNLEDIKYYIEIGQVGLTNDASPYFIHTTDSSLTVELSDKLTKMGKQNKLILKLANKGMGFPPSSLQSFISERPSIPGVFISNHEKEFRNKFYNSLFDDEVHLKYVHNDSNSIPTVKVAELAATIANAVLSLAGVDVSHHHATPDVKNADDLLHCYIESGNCDLFQLVAGSDKMQPTPMDLYVGVNRHHIFATQLTRFLMMYYQGLNLTTIRKEDDCKTPENLLNVNYRWINGSCFQTTVNVSDAVSPAFVIHNYDWNSGQYSTWTESVWQQFSVRIFLKPSRTHEVITLVSGIIVLVLSFVIVGWISSKSNIIFPPMRPAGMVC